jgi:hypothetical protein
MIMLVVYEQLILYTALVDCHKHGLVYLSNGHIIIDDHTSCGILLPYNVDLRGLWEIQKADYFMNFHHRILADLISHQIRLNLLNSTYYIRLQTLTHSVKV